MATHWTQLAVLRIIGGVADAIAMPALLATTASLGKNQPGKFFGILRASQGLSFVVGPTLGAVFSLYSLRAPFLADGVLSLLAFFSAFKLIKGSEKAKPSHDFRALQGILKIFSIPRMYLYLLMGISGLFGYGVLNSFVPIKSQQLGMEAWQIGMILAGGAVIFTCVSFVAGTLSDRYGRRLFVIVSQLIIIIGCAGLVFSNTFISMLIFFCIFCIGEATTFLLSFVYATRVFHEKTIGRSMGIFDSIIDFSLFIAPLMAIAPMSTR